jgi:predicted esterase
VIFPGGDGSEEFNPFIRNIYANALPHGFLVAQAIAPRWRDDANRVIWPTRGLPDDAMRFSTEDFLDAIIADVKSRAQIDDEHIYALGWSSGGPPVYAAAMREKTPLRGAFVAMSVFKPEQLPTTESLNGRAFYILHSPTDFIRMVFPEKAVSILSTRGAAAKLVTYDGGHGWHGNVFGNIRAGMEWLISQSRHAEASPNAGR